MRARLLRLIAIADEPGDSDDMRLRKRVGVVGGYVTIVAPAGAPVLSGGNPIALAFAIGLSAASILNLVALSRTRRFERYVVILSIAGITFTLVMDVVAGGLAAGAGVIWLFLGPVYALLALGPRKAVGWFVVFLGAVALAAAIDPIVTAHVSPPAYAVRVISFAQNIAVPLAITFFLFRYTDIQRRSAEARADELLTNAIPASIAIRLRHGEQRIAEAYPETTVLFADIVGFTPWARQTAPDRVVAVLDELFSAFDARAAECGVEKIKTIGDAYMAVAGAPDRRPDHATAALRLATGILEVVTEQGARMQVPLQVRIGLASGPVVAGVIGQRRLLFDLWGDTVNLAARMESSGVPGRIQVSASTWELLRGSHRFEPREIDIKGLGPMTAYLLEIADS